MNNTFGNNSLDPFISMSTSFVLVFIIFLMIVKSCENVKKKCQNDDYLLLYSIEPFTEPTKYTCADPTSKLIGNNICYNCPLGSSWDDNSKGCNGEALQP